MKKFAICILSLLLSAVCPAQNLTPQERERQLSALYVKKASKIYLDSIPAMQNIHDYLIKEDAGEKIAYSSYSMTLNSLEKNVRRYKTLTPVTSTVRKAHSYSLAYMKNTLFQIAYLRSWAKSRDEKYLYAGNEYAAKAEKYLALMTNEYEIIVNKVK